MEISKLQNLLDRFQKNDSWDFYKKLLNLPPKTTFNDDDAQLFSADYDW